MDGVQNIPISGARAGTRARGGVGVSWTRDAGARGG